jgi:hypothetical protein
MKCPNYRKIPWSSAAPPSDFWRTKTAKGSEKSGNYCHGIVQNAAALVRLLELNKFGIGHWSFIVEMVSLKKSERKLSDTIVHQYGSFETSHDLS